MDGVPGQLSEYLLTFGVSVSRTEDIHILLLNDRRSQRNVRFLWASLIFLSENELALPKLLFPTPGTED